MEKRLTDYQLFDGRTLKIIAVITMILDHVGAFLFVYATPLYNQGAELVANSEMWYQVMRQIGRIAFPLFCFFLVEGFFHTRDSFLYLARLMCFAVLSEIPFDLAVSSKVVSWKNQNVFFTLALGLGMMMVPKAVTNPQKEKREKASLYPHIDLFHPLVIIAFVVVAELIKCDYTGYGILLIAIFYYTRNRRIVACIAGYLAFLWEPFCLPAFLLIPFYNGKRGKQMKYLFYAFYPLHLLAIVWLRYVLFDIGIKFS